MFSKLCQWKTQGLLSLCALPHHSLLVLLPGGGMLLHLGVKTPNTPRSHLGLSSKHHSQLQQEQ